MASLRLYFMILEQQHVFFSLNVTNSTFSLHCCSADTCLHRIFHSSLIHFFCLVSVSSHARLTRSRQQTLMPARTRIHMLPPSCIHIALIYELCSRRFIKAMISHKMSETRVNMTRGECASLSARCVAAGSQQSCKILIFYL